MDAAFWHNCWQRSSLGFHQQSVHPFLSQVLKPRIKASHSQVFVPLCGKSLDMVWLAEHFNVIGAELSDIACSDFFADKAIDYQITSQAPFQLYSFDNITLWQGDFFQLPLANNLIDSEQTFFDWIYDRAALIALPKAMQQLYVEKLTSYLAKDTKLLLVTLEFPEQELSGPPFPIFESDVKRLFNGFTIECLTSHELADKRFAQRTFNVSYLTERAYLISR